MDIWKQAMYLHINLSQLVTIANSFWVMSRISCPLFLLSARILSGQNFSYLVQVIAVSLSSYVYLPCCTQKMLFLWRHLSSLLLHSFYLLLHIDSMNHILNYSDYSRAEHFSNVLNFLSLYIRSHTFSSCNSLHSRFHKCLLNLQQITESLENQDKPLVDISGTPSLIKFG